MKLKKIILIALFIASLSNTSDAIELNQVIKKINDNDYKKITSVVVSKGNQIIFEKYFNSGGIKVKNDMRSASKSMTSLAIGLAIQEGLIKDVQQNVLFYFKDKLPIKNPDARKEQITVEDLLTMSSSLECDDWNNASRGNEERMYLIEDWSKFILSLPIKGTPPWKLPPEKSKYGRSFSYCTGGVQILTDLVERVTKITLASYLQEKVFTPLAIDPPEFSYTPLGVTNGGGGMKMTSRDWIKIGQMMMNQGQFKGKSLIGSAWVTESFIRRAEIDEGRKTEYGYLWWIFDFDIETESGQKSITAYAAAGNGGNYLFMLPSLDAQVVITSQAYNTSYMHQQSQEILTKHIIPALLK